MSASTMPRTDPNHMAKTLPKVDIPSRELTYPPKMAFWVDDFPFPKVGYVNFVEGTP